jgi:hypothetical protein
MKKNYFLRKNTKIPISEFSQSIVTLKQYPKIETSLGRKIKFSLFLYCEQIDTKI